MGIDSAIFNEVDIGDNRKSILDRYLKYCLMQAELGHPLSRTLKHVFGLNRGLKNAKAYRKLILETIQRNNVEATKEDLISMV